MNEQEAIAFSGLLLKYLRKELSSKEERLFLESVASDQQKQELLNYYKDGSGFKQRLDYMDSLDIESAWTKVLEKSGHRERGRHGGWRWLQYAAILTCILAAGFLLYNYNHDEGIIRNNTYGFSNDILPGKDQAVLLLSDGRAVHLDESDRYVNENGRVVSASGNGQLVYLETAKESHGRYNEIRVPSSGQYKLVLSDGTKVWINSSSVLKFPVSFEKERRVTLEGEAFFEIAKDSKHPFYIEVGKRTIQVLGTRFNVSAYGEEVMTTLVDGSVKVSDLRTEKMLEPGQQAVCNPAGIIIRPAHVRESTAWKDGYFVFDQENITVIMDQIARWYNVTIHYEGSMRQDLYSGSVPRSSTLGGVLQMLMDVSNLRFEIHDRDVTVRN